MLPVSCRQTISLPNAYSLLVWNDGLPTIDTESIFFVVHDWPIVIWKLVCVSPHLIKIVFHACLIIINLCDLVLYAVKYYCIPFLMFFRMMVTKLSLSGRLCSWIRPRAWRISCCTMPLSSHLLPMLSICRPPVIPKEEKHLRCESLHHNSEMYNY